MISVECGVFAIGAALLAVSRHRLVLHRAEGLLLGLAAGALFGVSNVAIKYLTHAPGTLHGLVSLARAVLREGAETGRRPRHAYRRAGRPCPRCGTSIRVEHQGRDLPRLTFWCPICQHDPRSRA